MGRARKDRTCRRLICAVPIARRSARPRRAPLNAGGQAKQRVLIYVDMGDFTHAVAACADLAEHLTKRAMSSDQALRGFKAAMDAALAGARKR